MKSAPPLLSVIIPAYNAEAYLADTLNSVVTQDWAPLEILVVDDGSTDGSLTVAEAFGHGVRAIAVPHGGLAATRNAGIAAARGKFLLHLDADDLLTSQSISIRMQHFKNDPTLDMVVGRLTCFFSPDMSDEDRSRYFLPPEPQQGHLPGTAIIRASAFKRFGCLDESFKVNADLDWSVRAKDSGVRSILIDDVVLKRRIHGKNQTIIEKKDLDPTRLRILRASLARRRLPI